MRKRKWYTFISILVAMVLLINIVVITPVLALPNTNSIYSEISEVAAGSTAEIPILISNNSGIAGFAIYITYDPDVFTPISVTDAGGIIPGKTQNSIGGNLPHIPENTVKIMCSGDSNFTSNGLLFTVRFSVDPNASGNTVLQVSYDEDDTIDEDINEVELSCSNIPLTISNTGLNLLPQIELTAENIFAEHRVLLRGILKEPKELSSARITLQYNSSSFRYISANSLASISGITNTIGSLSFSLSNINTVEKGEELFEVVFAYTSTVSAGQYQFVGSAATVVGASDVVFVNSSLELTDVPSAAAVISSVGGLTNNQGHIVSVPIMIQQNPGLMGYKLSFSYNSADISPVSATNDLLFPTGSFGDNIGIKPNSFDVLWNGIDPSDENGQIFHIDFEVLARAVKETVITLSYSAQDTYDGDYQDVLLQCSSITLELNNYTEVHNTVLPTCCETGYTGDVYCRECGEKLAVGAAISATGNHVDADGNWESDATQHWHTCYYGTSFDIANHTFSNGVCTLCGAEEPAAGPEVDSTLAFYNVSLSLQDSLTFNFLTRNKALNAFDLIYVEFSCNDFKTGTYVTVDQDPTPYTNSYKMFTYSVFSMQMTDDITAVIHGFKGDTEYVGEPYVVSVESYVLSKIEAANEATKSIFANMLEYGAKSQILFSYNTDDLANANIGTYASYVTTTAPTVVDQSATTGTAGTVTLAQTGLGVEEAVKPQFAVQLPKSANKANYYAVITYTDAAGTPVSTRVNGSDFLDITNRVKGIYVTGLRATEGKIPVNLTVYDAATDAAVSQTFTYSIQSRIYAAQNNANTPVAQMNLLNALMNYYNAVEAAYT